MMECLFDAYVALTEETISFFTEPELQRKLAIAQGIDSLREVMQVNPQYLYQQRDIPPGVRYLQRQLRQINPCILTQPIVQMALDMAEKAGDVPVPYEPFLKLPFWVEFERMAVGDEATQFGAILAMRDFEVGPGFVQK